MKSLLLITSILLALLAITNLVLAECPGTATYTDTLTISCNTNCEVDTLKDDDLGDNMGRQHLRLVRINREGALLQV